MGGLAVGFDCHYDRAMLSRSPQPSCIARDGAGTLVESPKEGQAVELLADALAVVGSSEAATYPMQGDGPRCVTDGAMRAAG